MTETVQVPLTVRELRILLNVTSDDQARPKGVPRLVWSGLWLKLMQAARTMP